MQKKSVLAALDDYEPDADEQQGSVNRPLNDNEIVYELESLLFNGDHDEIVSFLTPIIGKDPVGFKRAKQLLREARDRGKAKLVRVHGVAQVILSELEPKEDNDA